ncbi:MAG TPA: hypothetical protein EYN51_10325 [Flavobacteriales bacterium]|nr:hypothetical protein [Flavobacteriales bacterium]
MKNTRNLAEATLELNKIAEQDFFAVYTNADLGTRQNLYQYPKEIIFGLFNYMVISPEREATTFNFSRLQFSESEWSDSMAALYRMEEEGHFMYKPRFLVDSGNIDDYVSFKNAKTPVGLEDIWKLVNEIFSSQFISKNRISPKSLSRAINKMQLAFPPKGELRSENPVPVFRLEEIRNDLRIILWVNPLDFDVKLCFTHLDSLGIKSFIPEYYNTEFHWFDLYHELSARHHLDFREKWGFPQSPLALNNTQMFSIAFDCIDVEGVPLDLWAESGASQIAFLDKLLETCFLSIGRDIYQCGYIKADETEETPVLEGIPENIQSRPIRQYIGKRVFSTPEYDIILHFIPVDLEDDHGQGFVAAAASLTCHPFTTEPRPDLAWYYHPIVYDAGK